MEQLKGYIITTETPDHYIKILTTATMHGSNRWSDCHTGIHGSGTAKFKIWATKAAAEKAQAAGKFVGNYRHNTHFSETLETHVQPASALLRYGYSVYTSSTPAHGPSMSAYAWIVTHNSDYSISIQGAVLRDLERQRQKQIDAAKQYEAKLADIAECTQALEAVNVNDLKISYEG